MFLDNLTSKYFDDILVSERYLSSLHSIIVNDRLKCVDSVLGFTIKKSNVNAKMDRFSS